jgi:hypothetical protein
MGEVLEAVVNLPGDFRRGSIRELDPDDESVREWKAAGWVKRPGEGARAARAQLAEEEVTEATVAGAGLGEGDVPAAKDADETPGRARRR